MKNIKKAFTLAEVLMVVAIIGIVATIAIPNLASNMSEEKTVAILRSTVNQLNAAYGKAMSEYGSTYKIDNYFDVCGSSLTAIPCFSREVVSFLDVGRDCGTENDGICFTNGKLYDVDGTVAEGRDNATSECSRTFIMSNGAHVCIDSGVGYAGVFIDIDVDGPSKGPNRRGYDCFRFQVKEDGSIVPQLSEWPKDSNGKLNAIDSYGEYNEWVMSIGNLDYLKCEDQLNWINKHTCD